MNDNTGFEEDDLAFERRLFGAGRAEALPPARTQAALRRLAAGIAALQGGALGAAGGATAVIGSATSGSASFWPLAAAAKWLALGAVGGGLATFAWLQHDAPRSAPSVSPTPAAATEAINEPRAAPLAVQPAQPEATSGPQRAAMVGPGQSSPASARIRSTPSPSAGAGSDLAAEVTALDGIRTALAIGALKAAEQQLSSYRRAHSRGALRSEAEVLALDVLIAQGRKQAAASAAQRFIAQHPRDPQIARVRALLE